jgi:hypothetical protein
MADEFARELYRTYPASFCNDKTITSCAGAAEGEQAEESGHCCHVRVLRSKPHDALHGAALPPGLRPPFVTDQNPCRIHLSNRRGVLLSQDASLKDENKKQATQAESRFPFFSSCDNTHAASCLISSGVGFLAPDNTFAANADISSDVCFLAVMISEVSNMQGRTQAHLIFQFLSHSGAMGFA